MGPGLGECLVNAGHAYLPARAVPGPCERTPVKAGSILIAVLLPQAG
jgi:hypothetical protein